ncbi:S-adenosyl-L-methionine-dependent methyltransferase [Fusarium redolens]|uniref:S-adenosyl-L-methionine-dependent methyltransferase n=1 Tax=Fusarium redolens TaxID=48865 RepID=A0A9P9GUL8_FUSRE|nr:S-adenosyl-L-methionine-dependent methyltransferase [Fusarium redolens]KAH7244432.1 S-adenosyl-L-methionine-dependent methyltransferase [Fusarium redolens]
MTADAEAEKQGGDDVAGLITAATATATATATDRQAPTTDESALQAESEHDFRDDDSAIGDDAASSTASINSSIMAYRTENGRTYHAFRESINYVLPNDSSEQERLDLQHHLFSLTLGGKLYLSPIGDDKPLNRALDAGTGTGVWAIDFADAHPETQVIGIDLSPIQPNFLPTNLQFQVDDLEDEWTFSYPFDFVFARMMTGSIGDFPKFFTQSFNALSPGGWIECQDITFPAQCDDGSLEKDSFIDQWSSLMVEATNKFGRTAESAKFYKQQMIDAGFVNVTEVVYKWPTNRWPADPYYKELGFWCNHNIAGELSGLSMALFTRGLGWSAEEVEVFLAKVRTDMRDRRIHAWWPM